ncbi:MAG: hemolysin family protein [Bacillales bacterium]
MNNLYLIVIYIILNIVCFILSGFFSSADMAYGTVSKVRLNNGLKNKKNRKKILLALKLVDNYDSIISTILLFNDLVNIATETLSVLLGYELFRYLNLDNPEFGSLIFSLTNLFLLIIFGEILPKSLTKSRSYQASISYSYIITFCYYFALPLTYITSKIGNFLTNLLKKNKKDNNVTDDVLEEMVDVILKEGIIDEDNASILKSTLDYASTKAFEIMTPRVDIYALDIEENLEDIFKDEELYNYSRIPVYEETIDNIIGFVLTKELIREYLKNNNIKLKDILIPILKFPRSIEINDILKEFKKSKKHLAIIIDEYGGVEGLITMEDILEEIVGEIWDEEDDVNEPIINKSDNYFLVDGSTNLEDFCDYFNIDINSLDTEYVTIAGYCIELLDDRFAKKNDIIYFKNLKLKILAIDESNNIIKKILVKVKKNKENN